MYIYIYVYIYMYTYIYIYIYTYICVVWRHDGSDACCVIEYEPILMFSMTRPQVPFVVVASVYQNLPVWSL